MARPAATDAAAGAADELVGDRRQAVEAQRRAVAAACRRAGWQLVPAEPSAGGPGTRRALSADEAAGTTLRARTRARADRALLELAHLLAGAQKQGWALRALDCDREPPSGEAVVSARATFAPCEQQLISTRTKAALARARDRGVRLGRPPRIPAHVIERVKRERAAGKSLAAIANGLNARRIPTAQGGKRWYPATVRHVLTRTP